MSAEEKTYSEILGLIKAISDSGLDEVIVENGYKIKVKRQTEVQYQAYNPPVQVSLPPVAAIPAPIVISTSDSPSSTSDAPATSSATQKIIKSSMVGTFYRSATPNDPAYIREGDTIKAGQIVGIIEAMKLFNEIEADFGGKVLKILVDNASPVEFDQPLILIEV
jgi:acetyl-CoA carboxylase biotin carboxyl carrier protein